MTRESSYSVESREAILEARRRVFNTALARSKEAISRRDFLHGAFLLAQAGDFASLQHCGFFMSADAETQCVKIGEYLANRGRQLASAPHRKGTLHVITQAYEVGGHSRVVDRWIKLTQDACCIVFTSQVSRVPQVLEQHVKDRRVRISIFPPWWSILQRASRLRRMAAHFQRIVLHCHPGDLSPLIAFALNGGPPILLFNHADHRFWYGAAVSDLVLEHRKAGADLSRERRGLDKIELLPLPLGTAQDFPRTAASRRKQAKRRLGLSEDTLVMLSIANSAKFRKIPDRDMVQIMVAVLASHDSAVWVAVGPSRDERWVSAERETCGRVRAVPATPLINDYYAAADIYCDPFPVASITSALEAGARGVPVVMLRCPASPVHECGAPSLDREGLWAATPEAYGSLVLDLLASAHMRQTVGDRIRQSILQQHCGGGWLSRASEVLEVASHTEHFPRVREPTLPLSDDDYWLNMVPAMDLELPTAPVLEPLSCHNLGHRVRRYASWLVRHRQYAVL